MYRLHHTQLSLDSISHQNLWYCGFLLKLMILSAQLAPGSTSENEPLKESKLRNTATYHLAHLTYLRHITIFNDFNGCIMYKRFPQPCLVTGG